MSSLPSITTTRLLYIDTNGILSAKEYGERGLAIGDSDYRDRGRQCEEILSRSMHQGFRVGTLMFTLTEMLHIYQRWHYYETKIKDGVPFDEVFGNSRKGLEGTFFTPATIASVAAGVDTWLANWRFRNLVELYPPNDSTTFGSWSVSFWQVTRIVSRYAHISAPDCLHAAAAVVAGTDLFVSNDAALNRAINGLYKTSEFRGEIADVLGLRATDITMTHGAMKAQLALKVVPALQ